MPTLKFSGKLSYLKCERIYATRRDKSSNVKPVHSHGNYSIRAIRAHRPDCEDPAAAYALRMYRTNILVYFADGAIMLNDWGSVTTTQVLNDYGPVRINSMQGKFRNTRRWGGWDRHYPVPGDGLFIHPDGFVRGLVDERRRVNPALRAERKRIMAEFRRQATGPFLLDAFNDLAVRRTSLGYWEAWVPCRYDHGAVFDALMEGDYFAARDAWDTGEALTRNFGRRARVYPTQGAATLASLNAILAREMRKKHWYDYEKIHYDPIKAV